MTTPHGDKPTRHEHGGAGARDDEPDGPDRAAREEGSTEPDEDDADAHGHDPSTALAELGPPHAGPPPPRRTGVFVDAEDLRDHVSKLVRATLGGHEVDAFGNITFTHDDARVFITVAGSPVGPQVGVFSVTNLEVPYTPELGYFLLTTNHTLGFGAFSYDPRHGAVWLRHTLLGTTLDLPELQTAVLAIATTAAGLDHEIKDRFGGRRFQEAPDEVQRRMEPPETDPERPPPNARGYL
ncbi:MAG: T3SS (YopN, CesT) and YbjN peptide-binding chaperone 1 [Nitriliruptoraceae bacterium]